MRRRCIPALALCLLFAPAPVVAAGHTAYSGGFSVSPQPGVTGEAWRDGHMRTRYTSVLSLRIPPAAVRGTDRYEQIDSETGGAARTVVPETLSTTTQRAWQKGPARATSRRGSGGSSSFGQIVSHGRRNGSAGSSASARGSSLRSGAIHRSRR